MYFWHTVNDDCIDENKGIVQWLGISLLFICLGFEFRPIPSSCMQVIFSYLYTCFSLFACAEFNLYYVLLYFCV